MKEDHYYWRGLRHRAGGGGGFCAGRGGCSDLLPRRRGIRRSGDRPGRRRSRQENYKSPRRHRRIRPLQEHHRQSPRRVRSDRRPRKQRRPPDDRGRHSQRLHRATRSHVQDQYLRHVLAVPGGVAPHAGGRLHNQHLLHPGLPACSSDESTSIDVATTVKKDSSGGLDAAY